MDSRRKIRLVITFWAICLLLVALGARLGYIQLERNVELTRMAMATGSKYVGLEEYARGEILDRNGLSLTGSHRENRVIVFPSAVEDKGKAAEILSDILNVKPEVINPYLQKDPCFLPFNLTPAQAGLIEEETGKGITVLPVKMRYGADPLAVHITGHMGKIQSGERLEALQARGVKRYQYDDWVGVMGLEKFYEQQLKGEFPVHHASVIIDARGRNVSDRISMVSNEKLDPHRYDVITTIDRRVQQVVEGVLDRRVERGAVVVMKPNSGDIIACASRPDFDPRPLQIPGSNTEQEIFLNRAVSLFQPGSLFKLVLAGAALEEGLVNPGDTFTCRGGEDSPISCWYSPGHGEITLYEAVVNSCNPAFVQLGRKLGAQTIINYAEKMGLADNNITGLPEQDLTRQDWQAIAGPYNLANSSIGQGPVLATPLQLTAMMNTIASGGKYYRPRLVSKLQSHGGEKLRFPAGDGNSVISSTTATALKKMLEGVVESGVGSQAHIEPYGSAGKTGSAEVRNSNGDSINAWFSGYVPLEQPRYVITVLVQDGESGGETAAPVFKEIARELMQ